MADIISFKDWQKFDIRVGKILKVEDHPDADKLYVLEVDIGTEKRKLVAGLKQHYDKKKLKGKTCLVFTNIEPAKIRGVESNGMVLAAVNSDRSKVFLIAPEDDLELGSKVQ